MADASLFISILALVLSFLTFLLKLWQDYASAERAKVLEEVLARDGYEQAQAAAFDIVAVTRRFEDPKYRITRDSVDPRCQQHLPRSHLDYADIYLLHGLGMLNGELIVVQINALEAARQKVRSWQEPTLKNWRPLGF
jgi:diketogulonate reductase-like aldo/keto reductase